MSEKKSYEVHVPVVHACTKHFKKAQKTFPIIISNSFSSNLQIIYFNLVITPTENLRSKSNFHHK